MRKGVAQRRKRRFFRRLRELATLVVAAILAYGIYWLWCSPVWDWQGQLRITGNRVVSQAEILQRLKRPSPTPLYRLNPNWIEGQLTAVPAIAEVAVRRWLFPARLEITVLERQALVGLENGGGPGQWMDQEGVVFSTPPKLMKPQFNVKIQTRLKPGERLDPALRAPLFELLATWPKGQNGLVDLRAPHDARVTLDGWPVRLGELSGVGVKLGLLDHLKPLADKYKGQLEYIDLRYPASPTFKLQGGKKVDVPKANAAPQAGAPADGDEGPTKASPTPASSGASPSAAKSPAPLPSRTP